MEDKKLLIIDDEEALTQFLYRIFADEGFTVDFALTGREGMEKFTGFLPDVVLLDIRLPDTSGIEVLRFVKTQDDSIQVVMMTGFASMDTALEALRVGAFDYITKPFEVEQALRVVNNAWEKRMLLLDKERLLSELSRVNEELAEAHRVLQIEKELVDKDLAVKVEQLSKLNEMGREISAELDIVSLRRSVPNMLVSLVGRGSAVFLFAERQKGFVVMGVSGDDVPFPPSTVVLPSSFIPLELAIGTGKVEEGFYENDEAVYRIACAVLRVGENPWGALFLVIKGDDFWREGELDLIGAFSKVVEVCIRNALLFDNLKRSYMELLLALLRVEEASDPSLRGHSERVAALCSNIAAQLGWEEREIQDLRFAALVHDLGKIKIGGDRGTTWEIIKDVHFLERAKAYIEGMGKGKDTSLGSLILGIADEIDEMLSAGMSKEEVLENLKVREGVDFPPEVVTAAFAVL